MATRIQIRRDTAANWTSNNPIIAEGEFAAETDTLKLKMGDGTSTWNVLDYFTQGDTGATGVGVVVGGTTGQSLLKASSTDYDTEWADITNLGTGCVAVDHGIAATDQVINVCYGTGSPPAANTTTEGTLFIQYVA